MYNNFYFIRNIYIFYRYGYKHKDITKWCVMYTSLMLICDTRGT